MILGQRHGEPAPAAAAVERTHARFQPLGLVQCFGVRGEVGAGILHVLIEEEAIEVVADVVVGLGILRR